MNEPPSTSDQREHFHKLLTHFNTAMLVTHAGDRHVPKASKHAIASAILDEVERLLA